MYSQSARSHRRRQRVAALFALAAGIAAVGLSLWLSGFEWVGGAAAPVLAALLSLGILFSVSSGEVNDRLWASSSVMVIFVIGFYPSFLDDVSSGNPLVATAPLTVAAASGFYTMGDWASRNWQRAALNFGQLAVSGLAGGVVLGLGRGWLERPESSDVLGILSPSLSGVSVLGKVSILALMSASSYSLVNLLGVKAAIRVMYGRSSVLPWSHLRSIMASLVAMGVIGAFIGVLFATTSNPAVIPLTLVVFVVGQQVFTSMAGLRAAHQNAISGFVKTLEARDLYTRGHTEKVAEFCRLAGEDLGLSENRLERLRWAALIHDVGKLAASADLMQSPEEFGDPQRFEYHQATHQVDDLLCEVAFLRPMVAIASGFHPSQRNVEYGQQGHRHDQDQPTIEQCILAVADAFDAMTSSRSYRMAVSQPAALTQLRRSTDPLYSDEAVDALERGLANVGREYGPPEIDRNEVATHNG